VAVSVSKVSEVKLEDIDGVLVKNPTAPSIIDELSKLHAEIAASAAATPVIALDLKFHAEALAISAALPVIADALFV